MKKKILIPILTLSTSTTALMPLASCNKQDAVTTILQEFCGSDFVGRSNAKIKGITSFQRGSDDSENGSYCDEFIPYLIERIEALSNGTIKKTGDDGHGTVWFDVPASDQEHDYWPGIILQGHTDMVWKLNPDLPQEEWPTHPIPVLDYDTDGTKIIHTEGYKSSLGADNGIGLATSLALIKNINKFKHGRIRFLFTANEETVMQGARSIVEIPGFWNGYTYVLNLDTEDQNQIYRSCLGVYDLIFSNDLDIETSSTNDTFLLVISKLHGGHSGLDVTKGYANADRLAMEYLNALVSENMTIELCGFNHNVPAKKNEFITSNTVVFKANSTEDALKERLQYFKNTIWPNDYPGEDFSDQGQVSISIDKIQQHEKHLNADISKQIIQYTGCQKAQEDFSEIKGLMFGLIKGRQDPDGIFPLLSNNVGPIDIHLTQENKKMATSITCMIRGDTVENQVALANKYKNLKPKFLEITDDNQDRPWVYRESDKFVVDFINFLKTASNQNGRPEAEIIDDIGCVEPSYWYDSIGCGAIGFDIDGAHTPNETLHVSSIQSGYDTLVYILSNMDKISE